MKLSVVLGKTKIFRKNQKLCAMKKQKWQWKYIADRMIWSLMEKIRDIGGVEDVTLIQYNGEYHG